MGPQRERWGSKWLSALPLPVRAPWRPPNYVGLNVAADPLFTSSYTGVRGGLVILNADDPQMHSSQNEQDNRNYDAFAAKIPMLEPSDPAEAKEMIGRAYVLSEQLDTPVIVRITTRIAHVKGVVEKGQRCEVPEPSIEKVPAKLVMLPGNARVRRAAVEKRMAATQPGWLKPYRKTALNQVRASAASSPPACPTTTSRRPSPRHRSSSWAWSGHCLSG